jgi:very-short-patch-repair endonuclease
MTRGDKTCEHLPKGYWTEKAVCDDAKKYASKSEWMKASGSAYIIAHRNGWLELACRHMAPKLKTWDKASVIASARKHPNRSQWKSAESGAFKAAVRNGWLEEATAQMGRKRDRWTLKELQEDARKYMTRSAWKETNGGAYKAAMQRGVLDKVCAHMDLVYRPPGWWKVKQHVLDSARKFQSLQAWTAAETSAIQAARRNGWIEEATAHMSDRPMPIGPATIHEFLLSHNISYKAEHRFKEAPEVARMPFDFYLPELRLVIEFHGRQHKEGWCRDKDSLAKIRKNDRIKKSWAIAAGLRFVEVRAWTDNTLDKVRARLAKALGRGLGEPRQLTPAELRKISSGYAWDEESVMKDAAKYRSRSEWMHESPRAYRFALRHELAEQATRHMERLIEHGKWTKQAVLADARKYGTKGDWHRVSPSAYVIARRNGWVREACEHMTVVKAPNGYWTDERILADAARFDSTAAWNRGSPTSYGIAKRRRLVPATMPRKKKAHGFWTKERIALTAANFKTRGEFRAAEPSAYTIATAYGWLEDVCAHMPVLCRGRSSM